MSEMTDVDFNLSFSNISTIIGISAQIKAQIVVVSRI